MKKYTLAFVLATLVPAVPAMAYDYNQSQGTQYSTRSGVRANTYKSASTNRKTGGYNNTITNNFYYGQPAQSGYGMQQPVARRAQSYESGEAVAYDNGNYYKGAKKTTKKTVKKSYSSQERKFFLAHPFFQPLQGHVGSVTDFSYARNKFNFDILNGSVLDIDKASPTYNTVIADGIAGISAKAENSQFAVKEDLSFGLTDTLTLILMAQYDKTKTSVKDWSGGEAGDSSKDSGLNLFGIGLQNRFIDTNEWIVFGEAFFQHQKDTANTVMGALKVGYKIDRTTLYGIGRLAWTNLTKGDTYGMYVDDDTGDFLMLSYHTNVDNIFQFEGGLGAFVVLNKYFTLNGEAMFGHYDWHNQFNIKGAIGWQPADHFALNLYASTVLYDSAKGKTRQYMNYDNNPEGFATSVAYTMGDYKIKDYNEWKIGVQAILYF